MISDNGTHFINDKVKILLKKYGIQHRLVIPHHPQANGQVEVAKRYLMRIIKKTAGKKR